MFKGFLDGAVSKESACNLGGTGDLGSIPGLRKISWRRKRQPTSVFLPEKSHGQRSLVNYSLKVHKDLVPTE